MIHFIFRHKNTFLSQHRVYQQLNTLSAAVNNMLTNLYRLRELIIYIIYHM